MPSDHTLTTTMTATAATAPAPAPTAQRAHTAKTRASHLLRLPREVLHNIFARVVADDVYALPRVAGTCRALRHLVDTDEGLWRAALLALYDDPRRAAAYPPRSRVIPWRYLVQERVWAARVYCGWVRDADALHAAHTSAGPDAGPKPVPRFDPAHVARVTDAYLGIALDMPPAPEPDDSPNGVHDHDHDHDHDHEHDHEHEQGESDGGDDSGGEDEAPTHDTDEVWTLRGRKPPAAEAERAPLGPNSSRNAPLLDAFLRSPVFRLLYSHHGTHPRGHGRNGVTRGRGGGAGDHGDSDDDERKPITSGDTKWYPRPRRVIANEMLMRLNTYARLEPDPRLIAPEADFARRRAFLRTVTYGTDWLSRDTEFTPLHADGTVDWVLVDAAGSLIGLNILEQIDEGEEQWFAALRALYSMESFQGVPFPRAVDAPRDGALWDWAGVAGVWHYGYSFMNYRDWVHLCDPDLMGLTPFDLVGYYEELGDRVSVPFEVVKDEAAIAAVYADVVERGRARRAAAAAAARGSTQRSGVPIEVPAVGGTSSDRGTEGGPPPPPPTLPSLATTLPTSDRLPPIYFCGEGGSAPSIAAGRPGFLHGVVRLTPDFPPKVRWTVVVTFDTYQFRMEGVQLGAIGSARGWYGVWNDAQHHQQNAPGPRPHGPVWFWKAQGDE